MELYSGVNQYVVNSLFKFKREPLELLQILGLKESCGDFFKKTADPASLFTVDLFLPHVCS
jgi:hypothetical protein